MDRVTDDARQRSPRLLYLGDVPVEASFHGSALVYRLLQGYPKGDLLVVEGSVGRSLPARRLAGVQYRQLSMGRERWLLTRFRRAVAAGLTLRASARISQVARLLEGFEPEAVLTVAHGFSWLTAAVFAQQRRLPLHLIVHDDLAKVANLPGPFSSWLDRRFGCVYRQAVSRLCVSPFMVEDFSRRYGVQGEVLYPSRAADALDCDAPPARITGAGQPLVFAFGGTINNDEQFRALRLLGEALDAVAGVLRVYGPLTRGAAEEAGIMRPNVRLMGVLPSAEFIPTIRAEADVLFVPMSFMPEQRAIMTTCFPSKLSDYTAAGLPILIYGPPECSAVRWAKENQGSMEVVDVEGIGCLTESVRRLTESPEYRMELGMQALTVGRQYFSYDAAQRVFRRALGRGLDV